VTVSGNPVGNLADSSPLITSNATHNGMRDFTTGLDLTGVVSPGTNRLAFIFDQDVRTSELGATCPGNTNSSPNCFTTDFMFYDGAGNLHGNDISGNTTTPAFSGPNIISITNNVIVVQYDPDNGDSVADARIGVVAARAEECHANTTFPTIRTGACDDVEIEANTPSGGSKRTSLGSQPVAGAAGAGNTAKIELTSGVVTNGGNSNQIDFTFESPIAAGAASPDCFTATTSNNRRLFGDGVSVAGNVATVTFNGMQLISEMITRAGVNAPDPDEPDFNGQGSNCVSSVSTQVGNTMGSVPVGGNIGAVGTGYTTGPDSLGFGPISGGQVNVRIDQRADDANINTNCVDLLDNQGNFLQSPSTAFVTGNGDPNAPHSVTFTFDPFNVGQMAGILMFGCALRTFGSGGNDEFDSEFTIDQVFAV